MAQIHVLSAGAVKAGLGDAARLFEKESGHQVGIAFATAPALRSQIESGGSRSDIVIAPVPALKEFQENGWVAACPDAVVGSIKAGVAVHDGARLPDISSVEAFEREIRAARSLVYNEASSGLYIEKLMERLGLANETGHKTRRFPTGGAVMQHLAGSKVEGEIGFGQVTEILVYQGQGVSLVGPLPEEIGNTTTYAAGVMASAENPDVAGQFVSFLDSAAARQAFSAAGVE